MKHFYTLLTSFLLTTCCLAQSGPYMFSGAGYQGNGQIGLLTKDAEAGIVLPALLARRLFEKLNAAVQFDLNRNEAEEFDNVYVASWSVSFHAPIMKELSMSAWIYNPLGTESVLDLPSMARIGVLYEPSKKIGIAVEAEKDWRHDLRFKAGMLYQLHQRIAVRWGIGTKPSLVHAGISWNIFDSMALTGGWRYHSRLGSSLSASLSQYHIK